MTCFSPFLGGTMRSTRSVATMSPTRSLLRMALNASSAATSLATRTLAARRVPKRAGMECRPASRSKPSSCSAAMAPRTNASLVSFPAGDSGRPTEGSVFDWMGANKVPYDAFTEALAASR